MPAHEPIADALWIYHISAVAVGKQERNGDRGVTLTFFSISRLAPIQWEGSQSVSLPPLSLLA